jgi:hypothetical protein
MPHTHSQAVFKKTVSKDYFTHFVYD